MIGMILTFEAKQRLGRISTYMYFLILFGLGYFFAIIFGGGIPGSAAPDFGGKVFANSPYALAEMIRAVSILGLIITAALAGQATYQDVDNNCDSFFYAAPIRKIDYLAGRFLGTLVTQLVIFSGIGIGIWLGLRMPFLDETRIGPERFMSYLEPYLTLVIPNLIFLTAIFFCLAALGRKMLPVYAGSALLLIGYFIVGSVLRDPTKSAIYALADPFGERALERLVQYMTPFERNTQLMPFTGILLLNRIVWLGVGVALFVFTYFKFSRSQALTRGRKQAADIFTDTVTSGAAIPVANTVFSLRASLGQLASLTWLQFAETVKNVFFAVILVAGFLFAILVGNLPTDFFSTPYYPVTSRVVQLVVAGFALFQLIIIVFYSGELVWRERDAKVSQIVDALPAQRWVLFGSKLGALMLVQVAIALLVVAAGVTVQIMHGYFRFEFGVYFKELFLIALVQNCITCALAILIQTAVNNKYLGYFAVVVLQIGVIGFGLPLGLHVEHFLLLFGRFPQHIYSDMNGYTLFVKPLFWFELYWSLAAVFLAIVTNLLWVRGIEGGMRQRLKIGFARLTPASRAGVLVCLVVFAATGSYIFYNTNILNRYRNSRQAETAQADYEKKYRKYLDTPQPRITDVQTTVDLYPETRSADVQGTLWLENKTQQTIDRVALTLPTRKAESIKELSFEGGQTPLVQDNDLGFHVYRLNAPLQPGGRVALKFGLRFENPGFANSGGDVRLVQNGSFINSGYVPYVGYNERGELSDDRARHRNGLANTKRMHKLEDVTARQNNVITPNADWINFDATVSTSPDQIAIAPGYLQKEWTENGRRYFHYKMDAPILDFFSFNSGRYLVRRDRWNDVNLEIYYQPGHEFNLDRMTDSMKATLAYCSANFSPFQFHQLRVIEFPRYQTFAQSFANTIPFSEAIGFITRVEKKPDAIDLPFYVTSHEVAHQWWGHQEIAANVEGATALVETLAQYSALMVMKHKYGPESMKRFLAYELRNYLILRSLERNDETPLARVQASQTYIHYQKGSLVMYALQDYIGEERVNHALSEFVKAYRFKGPPYATSADLIGYLRKDTPPEYQSVIDDLFEHITLYESKAQSATYTRQPDGKYRVHLVAGFRKYQADSRGAQKEVPPSDWIDIGVLDAQGKLLYLQKHKIEKDKTEFDIVVDQLPAQAGIDPMNKLIDRQPDDNVVKVTESK